MSGWPFTMVGPGKPEPPPPPRVGAAPGGGNQGAPPAPPEQLVVVLSDVALTGAGAEGGYFYNIYASLHGLPFVAGESRLLGSIGPFQIAAALHHAEHGKVRIELPATELARRLLRENRDFMDAALILSFVRVNAEGAPAGKVIEIGSYEIEGALQ